MTPHSDSSQVGSFQSAFVERERLDAGEQFIAANAWQEHGNFDSPSPQEGGPLDFLSDLANATWLRIRLVSVITLMCATFACFYACNLDNVFESSAEINLVPQASVRTTADKSHDGSVGTAYLTGQIRLLGSLHLVESFVDTLSPDDLSVLLSTRHGLSGFLSHGAGPYSLFEARVCRLLRRTAPINEQDSSSGAAGQDEQREPKLAATKKAAAKAIHKGLKVSIPRGVGRDSGIVEVYLRARDPEIAQQMLHRYLDFFSAASRDRFLEEFKAQRTALRDQYARAEKSLHQSEGALADYTRQHGLLPGGENTAAPFLKLLERAIERVAEIREQKERIRSQIYPHGGAGVSIDGKGSEDVLLGHLDQQLAALETQYAEWRGVYTPDFPKMTQLRDKINYVKKKRDAFAQEAAAATLESATREEKLRQRTSEELRKDAENMRLVQNQSTVLKKRVEGDTRICQKILTALWDLDVRSHTLSSGVTIIEPPMLPSVPIAPRRGMLIVVGIVFGLLTGVAGAFIMEKSARARKVLDLDNIAADINARSLGIVPDFRLFPNAVKKPAEPDLLQLFPLYPNDNAVAHIIRDIETSLAFLYTGENANITLVSSAISQEGKTLVAASLAWAMSTREGQRTLVIDADMRRPRLHQLFQCNEPGPGLSTILSDKKIRLSHVIRHSRIPGLCYLSAGPVPDDALALLRTQRFAQVIASLAKYFNNIVIDSPPVLCVPDYMPLCHVARRVVMVVRQGQTLREEVRKSASLMRSVPGTKIIGVLLNRAPLSHGRYSSSRSARSPYRYSYYERYYSRAS